MPVFTELIALDGPPSTVGPDDEVAIEDVPELMAAALAEFMWVALSVSGTGSFAVEISNNAHGWQVIYSAAYLQQRLGFGGPSTPVIAMIARGQWRFGIAQGNTEYWDPAHWAVPNTLNICLPLP